MPKYINTHEPQLRMFQGFNKLLVSIFGECCGCCEVEFPTWRGIRIAVCSPMLLYVKVTLNHITLELCFGDIGNAPDTHGFQGEWYMLRHAMHQQRSRHRTNLRIDKNVRETAHFDTFGSAERFDELNQKTCLGGVGVAEVGCEEPWRRAIEELVGFNTVP